MAKTSGPLSSGEREKISRQIVLDLQSPGAQQICDATNRSIGVPLVQGTNGVYGIGHAMGAMVYRDHDWFMRLGHISASTPYPASQMADTQFAAFMPGGVIMNIALAPAVTTIFFCATSHTDLLRLNWVYGV